MYTVYYIVYYVVYYHGAGVAPERVYIIDSSSAISGRTASLCVSGAVAASPQWPDHSTKPAPSSGAAARDSSRRGLTMAVVRRDSGSTAVPAAALPIGRCQDEGQATSMKPRSCWMSYSGMMSDMEPLFPRQCGEAQSAQVFGIYMCGVGQYI